MGKLYLHPQVRRTRRECLRAADRGIALAAVLVIILVLFGLGAVALNSAFVRQRIAGVRIKKLSLEETAHNALEIVQSRMSRAMNYPPPKDDGKAWTKEELDQRVEVDGQWHGYRFPIGASVFDALRGYTQDFIIEGKPKDPPQEPLGVFEACLAPNCPKTNQWKARLVEPTADTNGDGYPDPVQLVGKVNLLNDKEDDDAYRLVVEIEAFDEQSGKRVVIQNDLLLVARSPISTSTFPIHANVVSRHMLLSGYINGAIAQYVDPDVLPQYDNDGNPLNPLHWAFGVSGILHWSCFDPSSMGFTFNMMTPCREVFEQGEEIWDGTFPYMFTNMHVEGLMTNWGMANFFGASSDETSVGLTVNDGDDATGDPDRTVPDAMINVDPYTLNLEIEAAMGRESFGGAIPDDQVDNLPEWLNGDSEAKIQAINPNTGDPAECIYVNEYQNSGDKDQLTPRSSLDARLTKGNIVLAPHKNCQIEVDGAYVFDGDLIITQGDADGDGKFGENEDNNGDGEVDDGYGYFTGLNGNEMHAKLFATKNVFLLADVRTKNGPGSSFQRSWDDFYSDIDFDAKEFVDNNPTNKFDQLGVVANSNVIIGMLPNRNVYSFIATSAGEIPYWQLDLTGDGSSDLLPLDGKHPMQAEPRSVSDTDNMQVRRNRCYEHNNRGFDLECNTQAGGVLPDGASMVPDVYNFALTDPAWALDAAAYGYVRNPDDPLNHNDPAHPGRWTPATPGRRRVLSDSYFHSEVPTGDLFQGDTWISDSKFRQLGGAEIVTDPNDPNYYLAQADSFLPEHVSRVKYINAKVVANGALLGAQSVPDKYNILPGVDNPNDHGRNGKARFPKDHDKRSGWGWSVYSNVNDPSLHPKRCASVPNRTDHLYNGNNNAGAYYQDPSRVPTGLSIFGGIYARYMNVLATSGLCVYSDPRPLDLVHQTIFVLKGPSYRQE